MNMEWTECEERDFAKLMEVGRLERLPAIRLYRRYAGDMPRALRVATQNAPSPAQLVRRAQQSENARKRWQNNLASQSADLPNANLPGSIQTPPAA